MKTILVYIACELFLNFVGLDSIADIAEFLEPHLELKLSGQPISVTVVYVCATHTMVSI